MTRLAQLKEVQSRATRLELWPIETRVPVVSRVHRPAGRSGFTQKSGKGAVGLVHTCLAILVREKEKMAADMSSPTVRRDGVLPDAAAKAAQSEHGCLEDEAECTIPSGDLSSHLAARLHTGYICESCQKAVLPATPLFLVRTAQVPWKVRASQGESGTLMKDGKAGKLVKVSAKLCMDCYGSLWDQSGLDRTMGLNSGEEDGRVMFCNDNDKDNYVP